jgi:hypothetical protein
LKKFDLHRSLGRFSSSAVRRQDGYVVGLHGGKFAIVSRRHAGELAELSREVSLVAIACIQCDFRE